MLTGDLSIAESPPSLVRGGASVLISTLAPSDGGVGAMTRKAASFLRGAGFDVTLAYYKPYRWSPELSVPFWKWPTRRPRRVEEIVYDGLRGVGVGVRFPELEFAHYLPTAHWRSLVESHDRHVVVSGSILAAFPIVASRKACLAWVATPYLGDRRTRMRSFPAYRRAADRLLDVPICTRMERRALRSCRVLALSEYTARELRRIAPDATISRMPMPVGELEPNPAPASPRPFRLGFAGRHHDPRKNVGLLLEVLSLCRRRGHDATLHLAGGEATASQRRRADELGVSEFIDFGRRYSREELSRFYRSLDVFVIPSHQEGLSIVGLEAMRHGCPVVSTRCGGPEEFVRDGENGYVVDFDAESMAEAVSEIALDRRRRARMSEAAERTVSESYSESAVQSLFWDAFDEVFGGEPAARSSLS